MPPSLLQILIDVLVVGKTAPTASTVAVPDPWRATAKGSSPIASIRTPGVAFTTRLLTPLTPTRETVVHPAVLVVVSVSRLSVESFSTGGEKVPAEVVGRPRALVGTAGTAVVVETTGPLGGAGGGCGDAAVAAGRSGAPPGLGMVDELDGRWLARVGTAATAAVNVAAVANTSTRHGTP